MSFPIQELKAPGIMTLGYFFIFPVLSNMLGGALSFLGIYAGAGVFALMCFLGLWLAARFGGLGMNRNAMLKSVAVMTLLYVFAFGFIGSFLTGALSFMGGLAQYIVVFIFFWIAIKVSKMLSNRF
jgi:hypothetical protein